MLSRVELRVRNRRSFRHYPLFTRVHPSAYANAMLGVTFCLLITFMMDTRPHHGNYVDQYRSHNAISMPGALREDSVRVILARDGTIYLGNAKVAGKDLSNIVRQQVQTGAPRKVYLLVDSRARYWDVSAVLDEVRLAGISDVAFLVDRRAGTN
jgi:biopolymer transport protein ExbD